MSVKIFSVFLNSCKKIAAKSAVLFVLALAVMFAQIANAGLVSATPNPIKFNCETDLFATRGNYGPIYRAVLDANGSPTGQWTEAFKFGHHNGAKGYWGTIALGYAGGRDSGGPIRLYGWLVGDTAAGQYYFSEGDRVGSGATNLNIPRSKNSYSASGDVDQNTGVIYMAGYYADLVKKIRMTSYDPQTGEFRVSEGLEPLTTSDYMSAYNNGIYISSDMAIDAEGHLHMVATINHNLANIIRIDPKRTKNGKWIYTKGVAIRGLGKAGPAIWGLAYLNGKLYLHDNHSRLFEINPMTGGVVNKGHMGATYYDMASCQVAPVISGKVFLDESGNGNFDSVNGQGVGGIKVELWKDNRFVGDLTTSDSGEYSFIVDSTRGQQYSVVIKQPKIGGFNAVQTWASANQNKNRTTAVCMNPDGTRASQNTSGFCRGLNASSPNNSTLDGVYIRSDIVMNTDRELGRADFALTTKKIAGSAPGSYSSSKAIHVIPGVDASGNVNSALNWLRIGDKIDVTGTLGQADGVEVQRVGSNSWESMNDAVFLAGASYNIRVKTTGASVEKGFLQGWLDWSNSGSNGVFEANEKIFDNKIGVDGYHFYGPWKIPAGAQNGVAETYSRFRFSTTGQLSAIDNPVAGDTTPWIVDGEVEDYRNFVAAGAVIINVETLGDVGKFDYRFTNIDTTYPSVAEDSLTTTTPNEVVSSSVLHAFQTIGQNITITQTVPDANLWSAVAAKCEIDGREISTNLIDNALTIPGSSVSAGAIIECTFTNGVAPKLQLNKTLATERYKESDQFTIAINNASGSLEQNALATTSGASMGALIAETAKIQVAPDVSYTLIETMAEGSESTIYRYDPVWSCVNNYGASETVLPTGAGFSQTITPTYGDDIICTVTNTAQKANIVNATITASERRILADGVEESIITVTAYDANNEILKTGGDKAVLKIYTNAVDQTMVGMIDQVAEDLGNQNYLMTDNGDGTYTARVRSTVAGIDTFGFELNDEDAVDKFVTVRYIAGPLDKSSSEIVIDKNEISIIAPGATPNDEEKALVTVSLKDKTGNLIGKDVDENGNPYVVNIVFNDDETGIVTPNPLMSNGDGTFSGEVTSNVVGKDNLGFSINGDLVTEGANKTVDISYVAGEVSLIKSTIEIVDNKNVLIADGSAENTATLLVTLRDSEGFPVLSSINQESGNPYEVQIVSRTVPALATISQVQDHGDGTFSVTVNSVKAGSEDYGFTLDGEPSGKGEGQQVTITYIPGSLDKSSSEIAIDKNEISIIAPGATPNDEEKALVTVSLKDKTGNLIGKDVDENGNPYVVNIVFNDDETGIVTPNPLTSNGDGTFSGEVTSNVVGKDNLGFSINGDLVTEGANKAVDISYVAGDVSLIKSTIEIVDNKNVLIADGSAENTATLLVTLRDSEGFPVLSSINQESGNPYEVQIVSRTVPALATISQVQDHGDGTFSVTVNSVKAGSEDYGFTLDGEPSGKGEGQQVTITYIPGPLDKSSSEIVIDKNEISIIAPGATPNDEEKALVTVSLKDKTGNLIGKDVDENGTPYVVNIVFNDDETGIVTPNPLTSNGDGTFSGEVTSNVVGKDNLGFSINGDLVTEGANKAVDISYVAGEVSLIKSTIEIVDNKNVLIADGSAENTATLLVTLRDSEGFPVLSSINQESGNPYEVQIVSRTVPALATISQVQDHGDGTFSVTVNSVKAGSEDYGFTLDGEPSGKGEGQQVTITYIPGPLDKSSSEIVIDKNEISIIAPGATPNDEEKALVTVSLKDKTGNLIGKDVDENGTPYVVNIVFNDDETGIVTPNPLTSNGDGTFSGEVTSNVVGKDNLGFSINGDLVTEGANKAVDISYVAGEVSLIKSTIEIVDNKNVLIADGSAENTATLLVTLRDSEGFPVLSSINQESGNPYEVQIVSRTVPALATISQVQDHGDGTFSVTVNSVKAGSEDYGFTLDGEPSGKGEGQQVTITYIPGPLDKSSSEIAIDKNEISIIAPGATPNDEEKALVTVSLKDKTGNLIGKDVDENGNPYVVNIVFNDDETGIVTPNPLMSNGDGTFSGEVTSNVVGKDNLGFSINGDLVTEGANKTVDISYVAGEVSLIKSTIEIVDNKNVLIADGSAENTATLLVTLRDSEGFPVLSSINQESGNPYEVQIVSRTVPALATISQVQDHGDGTFSVTVNSVKAGSEDYGFTLDGEPSGKGEGQQVTITYIPGSLDKSSSEIAIDKNEISIIAPGATPNDEEKALVTVSLKDKTGNLIGKDVDENGNPYVVNIVFNDDETGIVTPNPLTSNGDGTFSGEVTSNVVGKDNLGFSINGDLVTEGANKAVDISYVAGDVSLIKSTIEIVDNKNVLIADGSAENTATLLVTLRDSEGFPVLSSINQESGNPYEVQIVSRTVPALATISQVQDHGDGTFSVTVNSVKAGSEDYGFTLDGEPSGKGEGQQVTITYIPGPLDKSSSEIVIDKNEISIIAPGAIPNDEEKALVTVSLKDKTGNLIGKDVDENGTPYVVNIVFNDDETGIVTPNPLTSNGDGTFSGEVTSNVVGKDNLGFSINGDLVTEGANKAVDISYVAGEVSLIKSTIEIVDNKNVLIADGSAENTATLLVTLRDSEGFPVLSSINQESGNPYEVQIVSRTVPALATISQVQDHGDGTFSVTVNSVKAGSEDYGFTLDGEPSGKGEGQQVTITYIPGPLDKSSSEIKLEKNLLPVAQIGVTPTDAERSLVTVILKDKNGNPLQTGKNESNIDYVVNILVKGDEVSRINPNPLTNNGDGTFTGYTFAYEPGNDILGFSIDGDEVQGNDKTVNITYHAGAVDITASVIEIISATKGQIVADGVDTATIKVTLRDGNGNDIGTNQKPDQGGTYVVDIFSLFDPAIGTLSAVTDHGDGTYTATLTTTKIGVPLGVGREEFSFSLDGVNAGADKVVDIKYVAGPLDIAQSTISVTNSSIVADGVDSSTIIVQLRDKNGNVLDASAPIGTVVSITGIKFATQAKGGLPISVGYSPEGKGQYILTITSLIAETERNIGFEINGKPGGQGDTATTEIEYRSGVLSSQLSTIAVTSPVIADDSQTSEIVITLRDANGNVLVGEHDVALQFGSSNSENPAHATFVQTLTNNNDGTFTATIKSKVAYTEQVGFTVDGNVGADNKKQPIKFTAGEVSLDHSSTLIVNPTEIEANGTSEATVTVQLKDQFGNNLTSDAGTVALTGLNKGELKGQTDMVLAYIGNGQYQGVIVSTESDGDTLGFKLDDAEARLSAPSVNVIKYVTGAVDFTKSTIDADPKAPKTIIADGQSTSAVTVTLRDVNGDLIKADRGVVTLTGFTNDDGSEVVLTYKGDGKYTGEIKTTKAAVYRLGYTLDQSGSVSTGSDTVDVEFVAGEVDLSRSTILPKDPTIRVSESFDAGQTVTITVQLKDSNGNNITTNQGVMTVTGVETGVVSSSTYEFNNDGTYTIAIYSRTSGKDTVSFDLKDYTGAAPSTTVTYEAGLHNSANSEITVISPENATIAADGVETATLQIAFKDRFGNAIKGEVKGTILLNAETIKFGEVVSQPTYVVGSQGLYTATVRSVRTGDDYIGFKVVGDRDGSVSKGTARAKVTYVSGNADLTRSVLTASSTNILADGTSTSTITVQLKDNQGSLITTDQGEVLLTGIKDEEGNPFRLEFQSNGGDKGQYVGTIATTQPDTYTIGFELNGDAVVGPETKKEVTFMSISAMAIDVQTSTIEAIPNANVIANNGATEDGQSVIRITLRNPDGSNISDIEAPPARAITLTGLNPKSSILGDLEYKKNGVYEVTVVSKLASTETIGYRIANIGQAEGPGSKTTINFVPGPVDLKSSGIRYIPEGATIIANDGETESDVVTMQIVFRDEYDNEISATPELGKVELTGLNYGHIRKGTELAIVGKYWQAKITSQKAGMDEVGFKLNDNKEGVVPRPIVYLPGPIDLSKSSITINGSDSADIIADGVDVGNIEIILRDSFDNISKVHENNLRLTKISVGKVSGLTFDPETGAYRGTISSTVVDDTEIGFSRNNIGSPHKVIANFIPGAIDFTKTTIEVDKEQVLVGGDDFATVTVTLRDVSGNTLNNPAHSVRLTQNGTVVATIDPTELSGVIDSVYRFKVSSEKAVGETDFNFEYNLGDDYVDSPLTPVKVRFVPGKVDTTTSTITVSTSKVTNASAAEITADGRDTATITVTLKDSGGNVINPSTGIEVRLVQTGDSVGELVAGTANNDGTYIFTVTSTMLGEDTFTYEYNSDNSGWVEGSSVTVSYTTGETEFDEEASSIEANPTTIDADGVASSTVTVKLFYASNPTLPIVGASNLKLVLEDGTENFVATDISSANEVNPGEYVFIVKSTVIGSDKFHFMTKAMSVKNATVSYTTGETEFDEEASSIEANPTTIDADGVASSTVTVKLFYASNPTLPIVGATNLKLVLEDGTENFVATDISSANEVNPGEYVFIVKSTVIGSDKFHFMTKAMSVKNATVSYTTGETEFDEEASSIEANPTTIDADGVASSTVTVKLFYASNPTLPIVGATNLKLVLEDGTENFVATDISSANEVNPGEYVFIVKSTVIGSDKFHFMTKAMSVKNATVSYTTGETEFDEEASSIEANPTTIDADGVASSTVTVKLFYASNPTLPIVGATNLKLVLEDGTENFVATDISSAKEVNPGEYVFIVKSTVIGSDKFHFMTKAMSVKNATVSYTTGETEFDEEASSIEANPTTIDADGVASSTVTVKLFYASNPTLPIVGATNLKLVLEDGTENFVATDISSANEVNPGEYVFIVKSTVIGSDKFHFMTKAMSVKNATVSYTTGETEFDEEASSIEANPTTIDADGVASSTVTVKLFYASNPTLPIVGATNLKLVLEDGTENFVATDISSANEVNPGEYVFIVKSTVIGSDKFHFMTKAMSVKNATVSYTTGETEFDEEASSIEANPTTIDADGVASSTVTVKLFYASNPTLPIVGATNLKLVLEDGTENFVATDISSANEVNPGEYVFIVKSTVIGSDKFHFMTKAMSVKNATVSYTTGETEFDEEASSIEANPTTIDADGVASSTVTVKLFYASNPTLPIVGATNLKLVLEDGTENFVATDISSANEVNPGEYVFIVKSTVIGSDKFHFMTKAMSVKNATVSYTTGETEFDEEASSIEANPTTIDADGVASSTVTVKLFYASNPTLPIVGATNLKLVLEDGTENFVATDISSAKEVNPGEYVFIVKSTVIGSDKFHFMTKAMSVKNATVSYTTGETEFDEEASSIEANPTTIDADGVASSTVTVKLFYASNPTLPIVGATNLKLVLEDGTENFVATDISSANEVNPGEYVFIVKSTVIGSDKFHFMTKAMSVKNATVSYTTGETEFDEEASSIEANPTTIDADGVASSTVTVKLFYASNPTLPIVGATNLKLVLEDGTENFVATDISSANEVNPGEYVFIVKSTVIGSDKFHFMTKAMSVKNATVSYTTGETEFDEEASSIEANPTTIDADGVASSTVTVKLFYASNPTLPIVGATNLKLVLEDGTENFVATDISSANEVNPGEYVFIVKSTVIGSDKFHFMTKAMSVKNATVSYTTGETEFDEEASSIEANPTTIDADGVASSTVTVKLFYASNPTLPIVGATNLKLVLEDGTENFVATDISSAKEVNPGEYVFIVKSTVIGSDKFHFMTKAMSVKNATVSYTTGETEFDEEASSIEANPTTIDADGVASSTVTVKLFYASNPTLPIVGATNLKLVLEDGTENFVATDISSANEVNPGEYVFIVKSTVIGSDKFHFMTKAMSVKNATVSYTTGETEFDEEASSIEANPTTIDADGVASSTVTVKLFYASNPTLPIVGATNLKLVLEDGTENFVATDISSANEVNPGEYVFIVKSTVIGSDKFHFMTKAMSVKNATVSYTTGETEFDEEASSIEANPTTIDADGVASSTVTVKLFYASNPTLPIVGATNLKLVLEDGTENFVATDISSANEVNPGEYVFIVKSTVIGSDKFHFMTKAMSVKNATVSYTTGETEFDEEASSIEANPTTIDADGVASSTVTVKLFYASNPTLPIVGATNLKLVLEDGTENFVATDISSANEVNPGEYVFIVKSTVIGSDKFHFMTKAMSVKNATVSYTTGETEFDEEASSIEANPTTIDADGVASSTVTVKLFYASNPTLPIVGATNLKLVLEDGTENFVATDISSAKEVNPGEYVFIVKSTVIGSDKFHFMTKAMSVKNATVSYTTGETEFDEEASSIEANPTTIDADGVASSTVTVKLFYASNPTLPIVGATNLKLVLEDGTENFVATDISSANEVNPGEYVFIVKSTVIGSDKFHFMTKAMSVKNATVSYTTGETEFDEEASSIEANPTTIDADGVASSTVTVKLFYASNPTLPIVGATNLKLVLEDGTENFVATDISSAKEVNPGEYVFIVKSTVIGSDKFHFMTKAMSVKNATVSYTTGETEFDEEASSIEANPTTIDADGVASSTVTVKLFYASNPTLPIVGATNLKLVLEDGTENFVATDISSANEVNPGEYVFIVKSTVIGSDKFHFMTKAMSVKNATVSYTTGETEFDEEASSIEANPTTIDADGVASSTVTVKLFYASNPTLPIVGATNLKLVLEDGTENFVATDISSANEVNPGEYVFIVKSTVIGSDKFHFMTKAMSVKNATVSYTTGETEFDEEASSIEANPTTIDADGVASSTVTVKLFYASNPTLPIVGATNLKLVLEDGTENFVATDISSANEVNPGEYVFIVKSTVIGSDKFHFMTKAMSVKNATVSYTTGETEFDEEASSIEANPTTIDADGVASSTVTVKLFYASNPTLPIVGATNLKLVLEDGTENFVATDISSANEVNPGEYVFIVKSTVIGSDKFHFMTKAMSVKNATVSYTTGGVFDQTASTITADPEQISADGNQISTITVKMFYESDPTRPLTGYEGLELVTKDGDQAFIGSILNGPIEHNPGEYVFSIHSTEVGSDEFHFRTKAKTSNNFATVDYVSNSNYQVLLTAKASESEVKIGDVVMYTVTVQNIGTQAIDLPVLNIVNSLPQGFSYVSGSAGLSTKEGVHLRSEDPVTFGQVLLPVGETKELYFVLRVGAGVKAGVKTLYAEGVINQTELSELGERVINRDGINLSSNRASVDVSVVDNDPLLDESLIIGTVYVDVNKNGIQDPGEAGLPGVKIVSPQGLVITTDQFGRYHLEGIKGGNERGRNYILKVDPSSLPKGTEFVTRNPLVRKITPGMPVRFDFAVSLPIESILEVSEKLFVNGAVNINPDYAKYLPELVESIVNNEIRQINIVSDSTDVELNGAREEILKEIVSVVLEQLKKKSSEYRDVDDQIISYLSIMTTHPEAEGAL